jgi:hypothetical protein
MNPGTAPPPQNANPRLGSGESRDDGDNGPPIAQPAELGKEQLANEGIKRFCAPRIAKKRVRP